MTLILTNDDGIDSPRIRALHNALGGRGVVVAPKEQHSGCGHHVTTNKPIYLKKRSDSEYVVDGTPADSTRPALTQIAKETKWTARVLDKLWSYPLILWKFLECQFASFRDWFPRTRNRIL